MTVYRRNNLQSEIFFIPLKSNNIEKKRQKKRFFPSVFLPYQKKAVLLPPVATRRGAGSVGSEQLSVNRELADSCSAGGWRKKGAKISTKK
jgi:hypothetical protein